jgi:hypothetical protein
MKVKFLYIPEYLITNFLLMHEIDKMWKIENNKYNQTPSMLSFLSYGNNTSAKEKTLSMELPKTHGLLCC